MTAKDCILGRRSIRKFKADAVSHELLSEIVETASYAPSWKHTQITRYPPNGDIIAAAPVLMAVTIIKNRSGYERDGSFSTPRGDGWQMYDAGIASQCLCLAAYEKGLGSVILGLFDQSAAESLLELPEDRELVALIPVGYPDETPAVPRRKPVEELLSYQS